MTTIIIGDVHGMDRELDALLTILNPTPSDLIVFVGDLVDKGPDSAAVLRRLRLLRETHGVVLVKGNHEDKHERFRKALKRGGERAARKLKGSDELFTITNQLFAEDIAFLESAVPFFKLPHDLGIVVHAGIPSTVTKLDSSDKGTVSRLLRTRHVTGQINSRVTVEFSGLDFDPGLTQGQGLTAGQVQRLLNALSIETKGINVKPQGSFITLGKEGPDDPFWADVYDGRFGHVFFGHSPYIGQPPAEFEHATGLDTGAVFGGTLTAVVLEPGGAREYVSVPALPRDDWNFATPLDAYKE